MSHSEKALRTFTAKHEFFVGIDSDGCVFDSMEIKHKECFCPAFVNHFELQAVARYAREIWEFANLYGKSRGINRFNALLLALDLARDRTEIIRRGVSIRRLPDLALWVESETRLGNSVLAAEVEASGSSELRDVLAWSVDVNSMVEEIVRGVSPFANVREVLASIDGRADAVVVSQTPVEVLEREWVEHSFASLVACIAGQEDGTKSEHLRLATSGVYAPDRVLMVGDAPGDLDAARSVDALFFPIIPGSEDESWRELRDQGLNRFFGGSFVGTYQRKLLARFNRALPERPPWAAM